VASKCLGKCLITAGDQIDGDCVNSYSIFELPTVGGEVIELCPISGQLSIVHCHPPISISVGPLETFIEYSICKWVLIQPGGCGKFGGVALY